MKFFGLLIFRLFLSFFPIYGQKPANPCLIQPGFVVKIMPLSIIDSWGPPSMRIGAEARMFDGWSWDTDLGFFLPNDAPRHSNVKGFYFANQLRHYFFLYSGFISFQVIYKNQSFNLRDSLNVETGNPILPFYRYSKLLPIQRTSLAVNCVAGKQLFFNRFIWEIYGGLGFRIRNVSHGDEIQANEYYDFMKFQSTKQMYEPKRMEVVPNIVLGFKFGYWLVR